MGVSRRRAGLRPAAAFVVVPPIPSFAAQWSLRYLLQELYFKSHFKGLGTSFGSAGYGKLDLLVTPPHVRKLLRARRDLIDYVLVEVGGLSQAASAVIDRWRRSETTLNARLVLACSLAAPGQLAKLFAPLLPKGWVREKIYAARLEGSIDGTRKDHRVGQPDLLLVNEDQLVMVEMKVRGSASAAQQYDAGQLLKYMRLARYARDRLGITDIVHLILGPRNPRPPIFCRQNDWVRSIDPSSGAVRFRIARLALGAKPGAWRTELGHQSTRRAVERELAEVPVRIRSYQELVTSARRLGSDARAVAIADQLQVLARDSQPTPKKTSTTLSSV